MKIPPLYLAALIMGIGIAGIPLGDTAGKMLLSTGAVEPVFIAWSRYGLGAVLVLLLYGGRGFDFTVLTDWRLWLRAFFLTGAITSILTGLSTEPLANAFAAFFVGPIFAYFGAALFLKEKISVLRTVLLLISFAGVLLVVKPGAGMSAGILYALMGGLFYSAFLVSTRWLADVTRPRMLLLSSLLIGTLLMTPWGISSIPAMDTRTSLLILWSAAASAVGNLSIVLSSSMADASRLAPLVYMQLVYATLFGFLAFADLPDVWSFLGLTALVVSGLASFFVQRR